MKALEILLEFKIREINWGQTPFSENEYEEAIAELEALQAPKTCDGCKYQPEQGKNYYDPCGTCKQFYADYYEPKIIKGDKNV